MTTAGVLFVALVLAAWLASSFWMRKRLQSYKAEIRRLKERSSGMEGQIEASQQLDALLSAINEAVLRLDAGGRVIAANKRACELFGIDAKAPSGSLLNYYRDADWHEGFKEALARLPDQAVLAPMKVSKQVLVPRLALLPDGNALLLCMDITEQDRLDKQRRTFLSNLMHDLKTPLTSLLGYARSLESFGDDREFRLEAVQVIGDEAKHVNHLLDALLTLDQAEFSSGPVDEACDLIAVLKQVCDMLAPQCTEKQLDLVCNIDHDVKISVGISDTNLDRIVTNVLINAVNYSPQGGTVTLSLLQEQQRTVVVIEDQGEGIPKKDLPRVTERFYRVDKARSRNIAGHGLGLAIVKELLDANGGELRLSNIEPHGLRVEIGLPIAA